MTPSAEITVDGEVVTKLHSPGTDPAALAARLQIAARLGVDDGPLLAPLDTVPEAVPESVGGQRWRTRWPRLVTVSRDGSPLPWAEAGALLAILHRVAIGPDWPAVPAHRGVERLRAAMQRLPADAPAVIHRAAATLPPLAWQPAPPGRPRTLVHGDFHLGQLGRRPDGRWQLIDIDDLGLGDPVWDLARPAGLWAAGLIPDADWQLFLDGYRRAAGPALPPDGDPWPVLDAPARAEVVCAAAVGARRETDESQDELLAACARLL
ncbi:MAG: phosphotransferase [Mycobacterium sp.]